MTRIGVFGWGVVAPRSPDIDTFAHNLESSESWLGPFNGFGRDNFLVGQPELRFRDYRPWVDERFKPNRFPQLDEKMDRPTKYALASFIQALSQNPGIEDELTRLGTAAHVYVGTGIGNIATIHDASLTLHRAQRSWNRFWAQPERNPALRDFLAHGTPPDDQEIPADPEQAPVEERDLAEDAWWAFWADRSTELGEYLTELGEIESLSVEGDVEAGKIRLMREKRRRQSRLQKRWEAPEPPWRQVSANVIWNIHNTPASQISMLGRITGLAFAPVAACSTFGVGLKLAMDTIRRGEAKAVVVGATDPPPHPLIVGAFYAGRVINADGAVSKPLGGLRGTHVAGGAVVWIVGDYDHMTARGFKPLGMELLAAGVSADADHIITPSQEGPTEALRQALAGAHVAPEDIASWDLHATATPGDFQEISTLRGVLPESVLVTARKGTFGHGMAAGGGWELTAQYLGYQRGQLYPTPLTEDELNPAIAEVHRHFVFDQACAAPPGPVGKLSSGIGGINACIVSRPWE
ncbi:MAG: beta-ketoacyl synthase N-terminal-like domain-containing protein [Acidobacteriota bacterium]|nr:beta-ketoacyl synthase N-terminal-like domain-containing protein [Acidobacteriota bacterium]